MMILPTRCRLEDAYRLLDELKLKGAELNTQFGISNRQINKQYLSNQLSIDTFSEAKNRILKKFLKDHEQIQEDMKRVGNLELEMEKIKQEEDSLEVSDSESIDSIDLQPEPLLPVAYITVKYNAGFGNFLSICGTGPNMSWDPGKALLLRCVGNDLWIYETSDAFEAFQFKVLLNNKTWEKGPDHSIHKDKPIELSPRFTT